MTKVASMRNLRNNSLEIKLVGMKQLFHGEEIIPHCLTIKVVVCGDLQV